MPLHYLPPVFGADDVIRTTNEREQNINVGSMEVVNRNAQPAPVNHFDPLVTSVASTMVFKAQTTSSFQPTEYLGLPIPRTTSSSSSVPNYLGLPIPQSTIVLAPASSTITIPSGTKTILTSSTTPSTSSSSQASTTDSSADSTLVPTWAAQTPGAPSPSSAASGPSQNGTEQSHSGISAGAIAAAVVVPVVVVALLVLIGALLFRRRQRRRTMITSEESVPGMAMTQNRNLFDGSSQSARQNPGPVAAGTAGVAAAAPALPGATGSRGSSSHSSGYGPSAGHSYSSDPFGDAKATSDPSLANPALAGIGDDVHNSKAAPPQTIIPGKAPAIPRPETASPHVHDDAISTVSEDDYEEIEVGIAHRASVIDMSSMLPGTTNKVTGK